MTGLHLSHYAIEAEIGRGGMGIVYRARDTRLNRTVALKVLPASALASPDDRARFQREAQSAAAVTHPNVCHVYQVDEAQPLTPEGKPVEGHMEPRLFIAMEYIDGETLRERIEAGPLKLDEVVAIASQIAEALRAAHANDIVHRDIKSTNVMLTSDSVAKVLDFGLAKTKASTMLTQLGSTLGTVAYMSPEQARGEEVDGRSDLYSLGTVLYEMIAGRLPFGGDYEQAILYSILNEDPEPLTAVRTGVPMELERIAAKLLSKETELRYQSAADLLADLKGLSIGGGSQRSRSSITPPAPKTNESRAPLQMWGVALLILLGGVLLGWLLKPAPEALTPRTLKLSVNTGSVEVLSHPIVSPDRAYLAFRGQDTLTASLGTYVYEFASRALRFVAGSEDYLYPEFSPDGRWMVLATIEGGMAKVPVAGGRPLAFHDGRYRGWFSSSELFIGGRWALTTIDMNGNPTGRSYRVDSTVYHADGLFWATMLPQAQSFLTRAVRMDGGGDDVLLFDVADGSYEILIPGGYWPQYVDSGHIIYFASGDTPAQLLAQPFDPVRGELTGDAVPLGLEADFRSQSVTVDGVMATAVTRYFRRGESTLRWLGTEGGEQSDLGLPPGRYSDPKFSHTGDRLAMTIHEEDEPAGVFVLDLSSGLAARRTFEGANALPAWSGDDGWLYYFSFWDQARGIWRRPADGSGQEEAVEPEGTSPDVSIDGNWLAFSGTAETALRQDIFVKSLRDSSEAWHLPRPGQQLIPAISPDNRYVAFRTSQTGRPELHVQEIGGGASFVVSRPDEEVASSSLAWSRDGAHLYYVNLRGEIRRASVSLEPVFRVDGHETVATPTQTGWADQLSFAGRDFALHPDGERLLVVVPQDDWTQEKLFSIDITLDLQEELNRIAPPRR